MILQRLSEYYDRISQDPATARVLPKPGYSLQQVSFAVVLRPDGTLSEKGLQPVTDGNDKKPRAGKLLVPGQSKPPGNGINPCFLWDNAAYMLGFKPDDPKPDRTRESFEAFRHQMLDAEPAVASPPFSAVCTFLRNWSPEQATACADDLTRLVTNFGVFRMAGESAYVHDDPAVVNYWAEHGEAADEADDGFSLVTGQREPIAKLHDPVIKGVAGAQSSGGRLVSFNADSYKSYGKEQGANAPVGVATTFKYTNALNYLLGRPDRRTGIGDATYTYWAAEKHPLEDYIDPLFAEMNLPATADPEDLQRVEQVREFLRHLRDGHALGPAIDLKSTVPFYVLGLSPNAARISVRFWEQTTVGEFEQRLARHLQDMHLVGQRDGDPIPVIRRVVEATGRAKVSDGRFQGYDADAVSPVLGGALARAVLTGSLYPATLLTAMLSRLRSDRYFSHVRLSAVKGVLVRNHQLEGLVSLNVDHPSAAYHCGRLLCLLDYIQGQAINNINAGLVKKFYSTASTQPFAVFGRLIALTTKAHLPKISAGDAGFAQFCERQLRQIMGKIGASFPTVLTLVEQGEFALGFYQEKEELPDTPPRYGSVTARGENVRSKSEVILANALHDLGVNYVYELPLSIDGHRLMKPDFTVLGQSPLETVYIEYLGMSDNEQYKARWEAKLKAYAAGGITADGGPNGLLLTFSETRSSGIDSAAIKAVLRKTFNVQHDGEQA